MHTRDIGIIPNVCGAKGSRTLESMPRSKVILDLGKVCVSGPRERPHRGRRLGDKRLA